MLGHEEQEKISPEPVDPGDRLDSWKEVAAFLGRGVRTVQRWEEVEGLPIRRHVHGRGGTIFAYKSELQKWCAQRQTLSSTDTDLTATAAPVTQFVIRPAASITLRFHWPKIWIAAAAVFVVLLAAIRVAIKSPDRPAPSPPSVLISQIGRISQTVYSPKGDRVVYCWNGDREDNNLDLYVRELATGITRRLTSHPNNEHSAAWSTSGDHIAFLRDKVGVFLIRPDGTHEQQIEAARPDTVYGIGMSWSADGRSLVYSERESPRTEPVLFLLDLASGKRKQITTPGAFAGDLYPSYAPDGRSIAFVRYWSNGTSGLHLLQLSDHSEPIGRPKALNVGRQSIAGLDWMPDGKTIVYSSDYGGLRRLWKVHLRHWTGDLSAPEVVGGAEGAWQPSVERRNQSIIYSRRFWNASIWRMDFNAAANPPGMLKRFIGSTRMERSPAYSPDGKRVAFISDRSGSPEVWISDQDGHNEKQLTRFQSLQPERPAWSPNATWIAFSAHAGGEGIYVMNSAGSDVRRLTPESIACNSPSWSHSGQWVYCSATPNTEQIWRVQVSSGSVALITTGSRAAESPDGIWLYFVRSGALWRMSAGGGRQEKLIEAPVGDYAITSRGIYFDLGSGDYTKGVIKFYDTITRTISTVAELQSRKSGGLAVSPDAKTLLLPLNERQGSEVLMINGKA